jgi:hypothetical protein
VSSFVVASWEQKRRRERDLSRVVADTAEHAVIVAAAARPAPELPVIYEAWPVGEPGNNLRVVMAEPRRQLNLDF